jgi:hypothetical protein
MMFRSASRCRISATPNITAFVVPTVVPSGRNMEPTSMWASGFRCRIFTARTSSVSVSSA